MANTNQTRVSVCFVVPISSSVNPKEIRAAYNELRRQIVQFANAITRDPNSIVTHTVITNDVNPPAAALDQPALAKVAELQSIKVPKEIETAATPPAKRELPVPAFEDDEKPHIVAHTWVPTAAPANPGAKAEKPKKVEPPKVEKPAKAEKPKKVEPAPEPEPAPAPVAAPTPTAAMLERDLKVVFENLKRTEKSVTIMTFLVAEQGKELTVEQIVNGTKLDKTQISSWLAITGKTIKGLENVKRGVYKFTPINVI